MKKNNLFAGLLASALLLIALPASAVNPTGVFSISRYNTGGTSFNVLPVSSTGNFCYLSRVGFREIDTGSESSQCNVYPSGLVWVLTASLGRSSDQDAWCTARCYTRN